ncbi:MAG: O-antigen ligase family protein [Phycisphaerae bacterium]|nr:O-antigen ligase family protein [Phycisphaerae bacterium]
MDAQASPHNSLNIAIVLALAAAVCVPLFFLPPAAVPWVLGSIGALAGGLLLIHYGNLLTLLLVWLAVASVFSTFFWTLEVPGFFNLTADRILLVGIVALFVIAVFLGRVQLRWPPVVGTILVLLVGWCALAAQLGGWRASPMLDAQVAIGPPYYRFFAGFLFPAAVFFMAVCAVRNERQIRTLLTFFTLFGLYLTIVGLGEKFGWDALVWPKYILDPTLGIHQERVRGPFLNAPDMGLTLVICLFANLLLASKTRFWLAIPIVLISLPLPLLIAWTLTRSIWLAFLVCSLVAIWLWPRTRHIRYVLTMLLVAGLVVAVAVNWDRLTSPQRERGGVTAKEPIINRTELAMVSLELAADHPLAGVGLGRFQEAAGQSERMRRIASPAATYGSYAVEHNNFLSMLAETGVVGAAAYLMLVFGLLAVSIRLYRIIPPTAVGYFDRRFVVFFWIVWTAFFIDSMFRLTTSSPFPNGMFLLTGGLVVGLYHQLRPQPTGLAPGRTAVSHAVRSADRPGAAR